MKTIVLVALLATTSSLALGLPSAKAEDPRAQEPPKKAAPKAEAPNKAPAKEAAPARPEAKKSNPRGMEVEPVDFKPVPEKPKPH
jgi:hypothetical protein